MSGREYAQLSERLPIEVQSWSVIEEKSGDFRVRADFYFEYEGKCYHGVDRIGEVYPNQWAAEYAEQRARSQRHRVWINPQDPSHYALEKKFPQKKAISALILLGLTGYFWFLGKSYL